jgi:exonuclease III
MKIIGYNGRGLQRDAAVRALLNFTQRSRPDVLFLSETHLEEWPAECLKRRLQMDCKEVVRSDGRSGGLLLLWKKEIIISLLYKASNYIDVMVGVGAENV